MSNKELERYYKKELKDFAKHYVAIWNALRSLGLSDPQIKGAISHILENSGRTVRDMKKEARQERTYRDIINGIKAYKLYKDGKDE